VAGELLLDTSGLVSLIDRRQRAHESCVEALEAWRGIVVSTEAVLTEACYLLAAVHQARRACLDTFLDGAATLLPLTPPMLRRAQSLMDRYEDLPMDFADATLVVLAEALDTSTVLTTDRRDFGVYRIRGSKPFRILPE
jgi:predicted nucleic acid-binding protein